MMVVHRSLLTHSLSCSSNPASHLASIYIGSLVPSITPTSSAEDTYENDKDQNESYLLMLQTH